MKNKFILFILFISFIILKTIATPTTATTTSTTKTTNKAIYKMNKATETLSTTDSTQDKEIKNNMNEPNKCEQFQFKWDLNKIIDKTRFSKEKELAIKLSNDSKTATRVERVQGDDFPPVKIYGDKFFQIKQNDILEWKIHIDRSNGFIEIGIISPELSSIYFIKGFKNEAQIEKGKDHNDIKTFEFGEPLETGDSVTICLQPNSPSTMSMKIIKNQKVLGIPFNDIPLSNKFYPMIGLNDNGDQISIL